jgi:basic membrane lipoprotein Med (substrate-binding protein (PBP1-ABC) superfamily)
MFKNLAAPLLAACISFVVFPQAALSAEPLKIAFVYVAPLTEAGWVRQHEEGRKAVDAALGDKVKTAYIESVPEGADAERVIRDLAAQGNKLIFTPIFGYMEPTLKVAQDFPSVKFESITGSNAVMVAAQERGKLAAAYHSDMHKVAPTAQIVVVTHRWGDYYIQRARAVLDGSWKSNTVWDGTKEGMVRVEGLGPKVPLRVRDEVLARQKEIAFGSFKPFGAARKSVYDNEGTLAIAAGKGLDDGQIQNMNFLVDGVVAKIAK